MNPEEQKKSLRGIFDAFKASTPEQEKSLEGIRSAFGGNGASDTEPLPTTPDATLATERVPRVLPTVKQAPIVPAETASVEEVQADKMKQAQAQIDALNKYYLGEIEARKQVNEQQIRQTDAISTLTGLAGSTQAVFENRQTGAKGEEALKQIRNEQAVAISSVLSNIRSEAIEEARYLREEARLSAQDAIKAREKLASDAVTGITALSAGGVTVEGLQQTDPESYQHLVDVLGSEEMVKGYFALNRPANTIIDKRVEGGKYIIAYQNPMTGSVKVETVDLGLPTGYSKTLDAGDRILAIPDNWSGDPSELITINKGLSPTSAKAKELTPYQQFSATQSIAKDTQARTAQAREMTRQANLIKQSYKNITEGGDRSLNTQAIIVSFNKILDPTSVVRESEYDRTAAGQSLLARLEGKVQNIAAGGAGVTEDTLKEASEIAGQYLEGAKRSVELQNERARQMATEFGLNPDFVASVGQVTDESATPGAEDSTSVTETEVYELDGVRYQLGEDNKYYPI